ncbi:MAG: antibiotic biosynthesis monooxygenase [Stutzerimonas stutzeri]|nr:MAG: antibiotic biosynthesis monooxygenase [Stutzerimonas stutzeri]
MSEELTVIARLKAKSGMEDIVGESLKRLIEPTRAEAGCLEYVLHRDNNNPAIWILYERWLSRAALDAHFQQPYMQQLLERAPQMLDEGVELTFATNIPI